MKSSEELHNENVIPVPPLATPKGNIEHVLDILAAHDHPFILVGNSAQRWMGSAGLLTIGCDILTRDGLLEIIASDIVSTGHWDFHDPGPQTPNEPYPCDTCDADLVLRRTDVEDENEYHYLSLWSETTYRIKVDECQLIEVPDMYPWQKILVEEKWHPALHREDGWWFGPRLHPASKAAANLPEHTKAPTLFSETLPRGKSLSSKHAVYVPSLPTYLDALIYHRNQYKHSKPGLTLTSGCQIDNLTRYLYLELPCQQLPLLIELEEDKYMEGYLRTHKRKPRFVYRRTPEGQFEATRVKEWDPTSYPDWCGALKKSD